MLLGGSCVFMITGATLLDYRLRYSTKVFFQKRFTKTGIPFIFWSIVSIFWAVYISHYLPPDVLSNLGSFLDAIVNTKGMSIYWFFPPLFALYLVIPVFLKFPKINGKIHFYTEVQLRSSFARACRYYFLF